MSFNLVASTGWRKERRCIEEIYHVAALIDCKVEGAWFTGFDGLVTARTSCNPVDFVRGVRELTSSRQYVPRFILKLVPIELVVKTDVELVGERASSLALEKIKETETYKVEVRKRGVLLDRESIIDIVASRIPRKVNLSSPDWIVWIEVFPTRTGISVIKKEDVFSLLATSP